MSNEPKPDKPDKPDDRWVMPEPIYRSSPGRTPGAIHETESADDVTTQPGFIDEDYIDTLTPDPADPDDVPTEKPVNVKAAYIAPKKNRGCARSFLTLATLIALALIAVVIAIIYFLFYYKSGDTSTF